MILPRRFAAGLFFVEFKTSGTFPIVRAALSRGEHVPHAIKRYRVFSDFLYEKVKSKW